MGRGSFFFWLIVATAAPPPPCLPLLPLLQGEQGKAKSFLNHHIALVSCCIYFVFVADPSIVETRFFSSSLFAIVLSSIASPPWLFS